jgi:hypothetical protein
VIRSASGAAAGPGSLSPTDELAVLGEFERNGPEELRSIDRREAEHENRPFGRLSRSGRGVYLNATR